MAAAIFWECCTATGPPAGRFASSSRKPARRAVLGTGYPRTRQRLAGPSRAVQNAAPMQAARDVCARAGRGRRQRRATNLIFPIYNTLISLDIIMYLIV